MYKMQFLSAGADVLVMTGPKSSFIRPSRRFIRFPQHRTSITLTLSVGTGSNLISHIRAFGCPIPSLKISRNPSQCYLTVRGGIQL